MQRNRACPPPTVASDATPAPVEVLESIQRRVLWLATSIVHHANNVRKTRSGVKVGGHQASSASMVSIMTALYCHHLRAPDRVSVKPHAAPVLHAINYLLGRLPAEKLTTLRAYGGLQSYPSRTKDPDPVDFSTGSVGIGATASIWSALSSRYLQDHFGGEVATPHRHIALVGDAELDEGAIWEALVDPMVPHLGEVMWVIDLNRQSLDRVVPDIAAGRIGAMFEAAGWQTISVKYGHRLRALFDRDGGHVLRDRIDTMSNEEYQRLLRSRDDEIRERLAGSDGNRDPILELVDDLDDEEVRRTVADLGGHDITDLIDAFAQADATKDRPSVVFAYTIKAWRLPTQGHPSNHSALLTPEQWTALADDLGADVSDVWAGFAAETPEGRLCAATAERLDRGPRVMSTTVDPPTELEVDHRGINSTQHALGRFFLGLSRSDPDTAQHVVTVSPDVASSTNLGGWINRAGIWAVHDRVDWFEDDTETVVRWKQSKAGQHIELGIAEGNLVGLLGELGATWSRDGMPLLPIGTMYDPFVTRALEQWSFGIYAGGQSILIGTPSGVTLAPEGGAHQSIISPSIGLEQPQCIAWEPAFAQDLEWTLLEAMRRCGRPGGTSAYFRLSTRPVDQALAQVPSDSVAREARRRAVVLGGYELRRAVSQPSATLVGVGAVLPQVLEAAEQLAEHGADCDVICLTSPDLIYRELRARQGFGPSRGTILDNLFPADRASPMVSVLDGHPHTLCFLGEIRGDRLTGLGVDDFGQVGDVDDLYRHFGIDADTIVGSTWDVIEASATGYG